MKRILMFVAVLAPLSISSPALADVTVTSHVTGKTGSGESISYVKGLKMRSDSTLGTTQTSAIIDIETQKFISINHAKKEAVVISMAQFRENAAKAAPGARAAATLTPTGETKEIAGRQCAGYTTKVSAPLPIGGDTSSTMVLSGPVFIAKGAPGTEDYLRFYGGAAEKGFMLSDPRQSKGPKGPGQGMADLYKAIVGTGGIPYSMDLSMTVEGTSPLVAMMKKGMSGVMISTVVTKVVTGDIPAGMFEIPAGYAVKTQ
jgi:hypothetical protein